MTKVRYSPKEIVQRGKEIYERDLRAKLETEANIGKILEIDIETGEYAMDEDHLTAAHRLLDKKPHAVLYGMRIGYPAVYKVGGGWGNLPQP